MINTMRCERCGARAPSGAGWCGECGAAIDAPADRGLVGETSDRLTAGPSVGGGGRGRRLALAAAVGIGVIGLAGFAGPWRGSNPTDNGAESDSALDSAQPDSAQPGSPDGAEPLGADPGSTEGAPPLSPENAHRDGERPEGTIDAASAPWVGIDGEEGLGRLALLVDGELSVVELSTGAVDAVDLDVAPAAPLLVGLGPDVVYLGDGHAMVVNADGSPVGDLGPGDALLPGSSSDRIWVGEQQVGDHTIDPMAWSEISTDGETLRSTVRSMPMEFDQPDLVWGFNGSFHRLVDSDSRTWIRIGEGSPVAVGHNHLILNVCDRQRNCDRRWFDPQSGEDRGAVLAEVADGISARHGGFLSPDGRFMIRAQAGSAEAEVSAVATGQILALGCSDPRSARWSPDSEFLACRDDGGVRVIRPATGDSALLVSSGASQEIGFTFLAS